MDTRGVTGQVNVTTAISQLGAATLMAIWHFALIIRSSIPRDRAGTTICSCVVTGIWYRHDTLLVPRALGQTPGHDGATMSHLRTHPPLDLDYTTINRKTTSKGEC